MATNSGIYRLLNIINNKYYIGSTSRLKARKAEHFYRFKKVKGNSILKEALIKYGIENFIFEVIEECNPEVLIEREQYYIDTLNPEYNIRKIAYNNTGIIYSEEHLHRLRTMNIGRKYLMPSKKAICVEVFDKNNNKIREFSSLKEAGDILKVSRHNISRVCSGKRKTAGGYIFKIKV